MAVFIYPIAAVTHPALTVSRSGFTWVDRITAELLEQLFKQSFRHESRGDRPNTEDRQSAEEVGASMLVQTFFKEAVGLHHSSAAFQFSLKSRL